MPFSLANPGQVSPPWATANLLQLLAAPGWMGLGVDTAELVGFGVDVVGGGVMTMMVVDDDDDTPPGGADRVEDAVSVVPTQ